MKNDLDNEVNKKRLEINMPIPAGPLSDFLSDFYKIRHGEGVPGS